jgi:hypothetical protein
MSFIFKKLKKIESPLKIREKKKKKFLNKKKKERNNLSFFFSL